MPVPIHLVKAFQTNVRDTFTSWRGSLELDRPQPLPSLGQHLIPTDALIPRILQMVFCGTGKLIHSDSVEFYFSRTTGQTFSASVYCLALTVPAIGDLCPWQSDRTWAMDEVWSFRFAWQVPVGRGCGEVDPMGLSSVSWGMHAVSWMAQFICEECDSVLAQPLLATVWYTLGGRAEAWKGWQKSIIAIFN